MGIDGLLPLLKPLCKKIHLSQYKGQTLGVDISPWLYKGCYQYIMNLGDEDLKQIGGWGCIQNEEQANGQNKIQTKSKEIEELKLVQNKVQIQNNKDSLEELKKRQQKRIKLSCATFLLDMITLFQNNQVKMIAVLDGRSLSMKSQTIKKRLSCKTPSILQLSNCPSTLRQSLTRSLLPTEQTLSQAISILKLKKIPIIVAPYEADSQLAKLYRLGLVDAVVSQDSDLLAYGVRVLFKLDQEGIGQEVDWKFKQQNIEKNEEETQKHEKIQKGDGKLKIQNKARGRKKKKLEQNDFNEISNQEKDYDMEIKEQKVKSKTQKNKNFISPYVKQFMKFDQEMRLYACVLAGCDYVNSIKGIGICKAIALVKNENDIIKILQKLENDKFFSERIPKNYPQRVINAIKIFKHATVYNPSLNQLQPLSPLCQLKTIQLCQTLGPFYPQYINMKVHNGQTIAKSLLPRVFPSISSISSQVSTVTKTTLRNLEQSKKISIMDEEPSSSLVQENMFDALQSLEKEKEKPDVTDWGFCQQIVDKCVGSLLNFQI